ncbi:hypothetical protein [Chitinophaga japonensis]|uniref:Uncharacterized protein n=1 Tax=Chitinophaga japonensis TaxID=104662 RepID=A0A562SZQ3_CHIJA|nr:hypothetical protein [Chitinophaga japonensis]TWI86775.1 hypothetical protein LX66_4039 [Chitinophaga japonensis]
MMDTNDLLRRCCALIEQQLGWGGSDDWQQQDFEALSDRIAAETGVVLSVSTLKRVWGKVKYGNLPSTTTLNTLARFAGYAQWRDFRQQQAASLNAAGKQPPATTTPAIPGKTAGPRWRRAWYIAAALLVLLLTAGWAYLRTTKDAAAVDARRFRFSSEPLAGGIPNSVVFHYDAAAAGSDSVFIQQSWDPRRRFRVPANGHTYTSMYYYPGFFRARLIVGDRIVKEHDLLIPSNGWLTAVEQEPVPVYFSRGETIHDGMLYLPPALMESRNIRLQPQTPVTRYHHIGDFKGLMNDNFIFETELRSAYSQGSAVCQRVTLVLHCAGSAFMIPLGIPGCVAEMGLFVAGTEVTARHADLSGFGCNMNEWVQLRCEARNKQVQIWVNGKKAWSGAFTANASRIVGISYRFEGTGAVNAVKFARLDGSTVLEDTF